MSPLAPPSIDRRTPAAVAAEVEDKLALYTQGAWKRGDAPEPGQALVNLFAHLAGIVIDRLNRTPDRAFSAFLNLLGVSRAPPDAAIAPLTFHLAKGATGDVRVPSGSRVAATPLPGEADPPVFETTGELFLTGAELVAALVSDPARDAWSDLSALMSASTAVSPMASRPLFTGDQAIERRLWIADPMFAGSGPRDVTIAISVNPVGARFPDLEWGWFDGAAWRAFDPSSFSVTYANGGLTLTLKGLPALPIVEGLQAGASTGLRGAWIGGRLANDLGAAPFAPPHPHISSIQTSIALSHANLAPDAGFSGVTAVDLTKDFLPFGERPKLGDSFLLACNAAFAPPGPADATHKPIIDLLITASDIDGGRLLAPDPTTQENDAIELAWEYWGGARWRLLGRSSDQSASIVSDGDVDRKFSDGTKAFTGSAPKGLNVVNFERPDDWAPSTVSGDLNYWLRVRIASGDYGKDAYYTKQTGGGGSYTIVPATWRPPSLSGIALLYTYVSPSKTPQSVLVEANRSLTDETSALAPNGAGFDPFPKSADTTPALYLGFHRADGAPAFANQPVTLYVGVDTNANPGKTPEKTPQIAWEYGSSQGWRWLAAQDGTADFTRPGLVEFIAPADMAATAVFGQTAYWLRARLDSGGYGAPPRIARLAPNTVWAHHAASVANETIGSGTSEPDQTLLTAMNPVLAGQRLEVQEFDPATPDEGAGDATAAWVAWQEVPDFYGSAPASRHYTLDRLTGAIGFGGDGRGRAPPRGSSNIRISYRSGGGDAGNRAAGAITQMKSSLPYVDTVTNHEPAGGGADAQSLDDARRRGPTALRHQNRAVAVADYEDLVFMASPAVARAKALSARDAASAGQVTVIVVPRGDDPQPAPSPDLIQEIQDYLIASAPPTVDIRVRGPDWLEVGVTVEIVPQTFDQAMVVKNAVQARLTAFLHPLEGGVSGEGWEFGRSPYRSDFYALIEAIPGVDFVRALTVTPEIAALGEATLVYAGAIDVTLAGSLGPAP